MLHGFLLFPSQSGNGHLLELLYVCICFTLVLEGVVFLRCRGMFSGPSWNVSPMFLECSWDVPAMFLNCSCDIPGMNVKGCFLGPGRPGICLNMFLDVSGLFMRHDWDSPGMFLGCYCDVCGTLLGCP